MGWKSVRDHYNITHLVQVARYTANDRKITGEIIIGSPYISRILAISLETGEVTQWDDSQNEDLMRYQKEFKADPSKLKELVLQEDTFENSIPVWTYRDAEILEKQCEKLGYPNLTHDGYLQYDNTFSAEKAIVENWAKENAKAGISHYLDYALEAEGKADRAFLELKQWWTIFLKLHGVESLAIASQELTTRRNAVNDGSRPLRGMELVRAAKRLIRCTYDENEIGEGGAIRSIDEAYVARAFIQLFALNEASHVEVRADTDQSLDDLFD